MRITARFSLSPIAPPSPAAAAAALGLVVVVVALAVRTIGDPDLGWHLATGRSIVEHRAIPRVDDVAFSHGAVRYATVLADVLFYGASRAFGDRGLQVLAGVVAAAIGGVLALAGRRGPAAWLAASLALASMNAWVELRPATLSFLLLAVQATLLDRHRRHPDTRAGRVALVGLVPLAFVWANVHGLVALGCGISLAYLVYRAFCTAARGRLGNVLPLADAGDLRATASAVAVSLVAASINTAGPRLLLGAFRFDEELVGITEWAPTTASLLLQREPLAVVVAIVAALGIVIGRDDGDRARRAPSAFDAGIVLVSILAMAHTTRLIPVAVVLMTPVAARRLSFALPKASVVPLLAGASTLAPAALFVVAPTTSLGRGFEPSILPVEATAWIERAEPAGRMWNFWPFGGYLAWRLGPSREVFMDGRNTLARSRELVVRANRSIVDGAAFDELAREYGMEWAISSASASDPASGAGIARTAGWSLVYLDDVAAVYVRTAGPNGGLGREGYRILRHTTSPEAALTIATTGTGQQRAALAHDGALAEAQGKSSTRSTFLAACGAIAAGDETRARILTARLERLGAAPALVEALVEALAITRGASR
jgi:hypothetical protein